MGRFLTKDTWQGENNIPMSYNLWLYTYSNPENRTDPSGKKPCINYDERGKCIVDPDWHIAVRNIPRLSEKERKVLVVLVAGESSSGSKPIEYAEINIWMLLNKHAYDINVLKRDSSFYQSWSGEESGLVGDKEHGLVAVMMQSTVKLIDPGTDTHPGTDWGNISPEGQVDLLALLGDAYAEGRVINNSNNGVDLQEYYKKIYKDSKAIIDRWYQYGPGAPADPTHGGVGHWDSCAEGLCKYPGDTPEERAIQEADMKLKERMEQIRRWYACKKKVDHTDFYSYITPVYEENGRYVFTTYR